MLHSISLNRLSSTLLASLAVLCPLTARAQTPGTAIRDALGSQIGQWCWSELRIDQIQIPQFPNVRFHRGRCVGEHGDELSALIAMDADSVLYLLASQESLNFLLYRHAPQVPKDSTQIVAYAKLLVELAGQVGSNARLVSQWSELPEAARDSARHYSVRPVQIVREGRRGWFVRLFTIEDGIWGPYANGFDVRFADTGKQADVGRGWHWQRVDGP